MTVSDSAGRRFTIGQHIDIAYKTAGLVELSQEPSAAQYGFARQALENILDSLDTYGVFARVQAFSELTLTPGQAVYDLPASVIEPIGTAMYIDPTQDVDAAEGETPVFQVRREEWQTLSNKGSQGRPVKYFADRNADIQRVYLWLVPDEAGTIRFQVIRALADSDDNAATLDLQIWWNKYIQYALASTLAEAASLSPSKVMGLEQKAQRELIQCQGKANEYSPNQMHLDHYGPRPWGGSNVR